MGSQFTTPLRLTSAYWRKLKTNCVYAYMHLIFLTYDDEGEVILEDDELWVVAFLVGGKKRSKFFSRECLDDTRLLPNIHLPLTDDLREGFKNPSHRKCPWWWWWWWWGGTPFSADFFLLTFWQAAFRDEGRGNPLFC